MLAESPFTNRTAGDREAGARCPHCATAIAHGEEIVACLRCGAVHHVVCWHSHDGCGSFDCAPARRILGENRQPELRITVDEVARVQPPPRPVVVPASYFPGNVRNCQDPLGPRRWSRLAIAAVIVAVAGIPLFGVVTGLIAILLGSLALGGIHHTRQRGTGLAVTGILLGLADTVGWIVFLSIYLWRRRSSHHQPGRVRAGRRRPEPHGARHRPQRPRQCPGGNQNRRRPVGRHGHRLRRDPADRARLGPDRHQPARRRSEVRRPGIERAPRAVCPTATCKSSSSASRRTRAGSCGLPPTASTWP